MKRFSLYIIIALLFSCFSAKCQVNDCKERFKAYDTITANGNFIKYHIINGYAQLEYGNGQLRKVYQPEFDCGIADARIPRLRYDNKNFMLLHYGCGSPCWGLILLPLQKEGKIRNIMYDLAYDSQTTNLVYTDNENLLVENLTSEEIRIIKLPPCGAASIVYCLDSVSIDKSVLKYQFYEPHKLDDKPVINSFVVKID